MTQNGALLVAARTQATLTQNGPSPEVEGLVFFEGAKAL
jgi:hypothetical protein